MSYYKFGYTSKSQKHEHSFDSIKVDNIVADNPDYNMEKFGVWAFITRYCYCGAQEAADLLQREAAEERIDLILERG